MWNASTEPCASCSRTCNMLIPRTAFLCVAAQFSKSKKETRAQVFGVLGFAMFERKKKPVM